MASRKGTVNVKRGWSFRNSRAAFKASHKYTDDSSSSAGAVYMAVVGQQYRAFLVICRSVEMGLTRLPPPTELAHWAITHKNP